MIGGELLLKIKLSNPGTGAATGVVLTETIPPGLKHAAGGELEFEVGTLKPGEHRELDLPLTAIQAGPLTNLLSAHAEGNVSVETRTQCEVVAPDLKVGLTGPKRRYLERSAVYNISVTNPGTAPAQGYRAGGHATQRAEIHRSEQRRPVRPGHRGRLLEPGRTSRRRNRDRHA